MIFCSVLTLIDHLLWLLLLSIEVLSAAHLRVNDLTRRSTILLVLLLLHGLNLLHLHVLRRLVLIVIVMLLLFVINVSRLRRIYLIDLDILCLLFVRLVIFQIAHTSVLKILRFDIEHINYG